MPEQDKHREEKSLARLLTQAARAHRNRLNTRLNAIGLMAGQEQLLQALENGPLTMGELAATLNVRQPTVSKAASRLAALGLVHRLANGNGDSRVVHVALTNAGQEKSGLIEALWQETEADLTEGFDTRDEKRLRKLLRRAIRNIAGQYSEPDPE